MRLGKGGIVVLLQEVEDRDREELRDDAYMIPVVEPVYQMNAVAATWEDERSFQTRPPRHSLRVVRVSLS